MSQDLKDLLARIEGAAEGSQEIDEAVHAALRADDPWWQAIVEGRRLVAAGDEHAIIELGGSKLRADSWAHGAKVARHSTSVDAALSLVKASGFATCTIDPSFVDHIPSEARIRTWEADECGTVSRGQTYAAMAPTLPLAILGSLLKALIATGLASHPHTVTRQGEKP